MVARLTQAELEQITTAVGEAERRTSGEIVTVILPRANDYAGARWALAIAFGLCATALLVLFRVGLTPMLLLWVELLAIGVGYALGLIPALIRILVPHHVQSQEVHHRALEMFHTRGLTHTRDRTGVLLLVSLLERRVQILADVGIHRAVPEGTWDGVIARLIAAIGRHSLATGICTAIQECGNLLAERFPPRPDDTNELPNAPIVPAA